MDFFAWRRRKAAEISGGLMYVAILITAFSQGEVHYMKRDLNFGVSTFYL